LTQAREIIDREIRHLSKFAHQLPRTFKLGAMLEVPALLFQLDELYKAVDFVSVGSNDLFQFMMAVDRGAAHLSDRYDPMTPSFLRSLQAIAAGAEKAGKPVTLCGELAGKPLTAMALIGVGFTSLSMSAAAVGPVKAMLLQLDVGKLREEFGAALAPGQPKLEPMRGFLKAFAERHGIPL
jgi:phosphotransferase system, enzyme I, PtsP